MAQIEMLTLSYCEEKAERANRRKEKIPLNQMTTKPSHVQTNVIKQENLTLNDRCFKKLRVQGRAADILKHEQRPGKEIRFILTLTETSLEIHVHTVTTAAALECSARFSCVDKCKLGYRAGDNGCPTCECLQPITCKPWL